MRAAAVSHRDGEHHHPDVAKLLELFAPGKRKPKDKAIEDLQAADNGEGQKDKKQAVFDRPIDRTKQSDSHELAIQFHHATLKVCRPGPSALLRTNSRRGPSSGK